MSAAFIEGCVTGAAGLFLASSLVLALLARRAPEEDGGGEVAPPVAAAEGGATPDRAHRQRGDVIVLYASAACLSMA